MKNYLKLMLLAMMAFMPCLSINVVAQDNDSMPDDIPINPNNNDPSPRPRAMARFPRQRAQTPHCYYINGIVGIEADSTITYISATVTRMEDNIEWSNVSNNNNLSIIVSSNPGTYHLELTLSNGMSYYGEYTLE